MLVSVPHYGTAPLPDVRCEDYCEPRFESFPFGFADLFAAELYGDLDEHGASVVACPVSRMFCDVNRRRDDVEHLDGAVRSKRGVVRTHTMRDIAIFTRPLTPAELEARLCAHYDPYYAAVEQALDDLRAACGHAILLDAHTGSPRRMLDHQVIVGTRHGTTCAPAVADAVASVFRAHGFEVAHDVAGYTGGNIVATFGQPEARSVHAIQLEINAGLLTTVDRDELVAHITRGEVPGKCEPAIARARDCLRHVLAELARRAAELA